MQVAHTIVTISSSRVPVPLSPAFAPPVSTSVTAVIMSRIYAVGEVTKTIWVWYEDIREQEIMDGIS